MAIIESGTAPPNIPEWEACARVDTVSRNVTLPRSPTVSAGVSTSQLSESATTMTSASSSVRCCSRKFTNEREPNSSSPSMNSASPSSKSVPWVSTNERMAATWAMTPALSSAAPRP